MSTRLGKLEHQFANVKTSLSGVEEDEANIALRDAYKPMAVVIRAVGVLDEVRVRLNRGECWDSAVEREVNLVCHAYRRYEEGP